MKSSKDRRKKKRWQVAVLVRCSIPKLGDETFEMEMWAKDVNEKGMQLEWARGLTVNRLTNDGTEPIPHPIRFEDVNFIKGGQIKVQDLFYDDDGSPFIEGKILWAQRKGAAGWALGIQFFEPQEQSKAMMGAFKDFLSIVKNPTVAIKKASRAR